MSHAIFFTFSKEDCDFSIIALFLDSKKIFIVSLFGCFDKYFFLKSNNSALVVSNGSVKYSFNSSGIVFIFNSFFKSSTDLKIIFSSGDHFNTSFDLVVGFIFLY
jgi:hypothetical protein